MAPGDPPVEIPREYFGTRFRIESAPPRWPGSFTIVTAWAPTGEARSQDQNRAADARLRAQLERSGCWFHRITGYDPDGDHAEPGWAIEQDLERGLELAIAFEQLGLYHVDHGELWVLMCADPAATRARVAGFLDRLDAFD